MQQRSPELARGSQEVGSCARLRRGKQRPWMRGWKPVALLPRGTRPFLLDVGQRAALDWRLGPIASAPSVALPLKRSVPAARTEHAALSECRAQSKFRTQSTECRVQSTESRAQRAVCVGSACTVVSVGSALEGPCGAGGSWRLGEQRDGGSWRPVLAGWLMPGGWLPASRRPRHLHHTQYARFREKRARNARHESACTMCEAWPVTCGGAALAASSSRFFSICACTPRGEER